MYGLCEDAVRRLGAAGGPAFLSDPSAAPFEPLLAAAFDPDGQSDSSLIVPGTGAPQLLIGTAADAAFVAGIATQIGPIVQPAPFAFVMPAEPVPPAAPAAPATDASRIGTAAYDFFDVTTSQRVRIETRGGDDFIRLGNGSPGPDITAVVIGAEGRESIEGRGARVVGRFELGGGVDNIYGTFAAGSAITAFMGAGNDVARFNTGTNYIDGGADNDNLTGGNQDDTLIGGDGNDTIFGEGFADFNAPEPGGNDLIFGGAGNDTLWGAGGDDLLIGGDGDDTLIGMWNNDRLWGGAGIDMLQGGTGNDLLHGGIGNDRLFGEADDDQLDGGEGDDELYGGDGNDVLVDASGTDRLFGGNGSDRLRGGAGVNVMNGDAGDDIVFGEGGDDSLQGGIGNDSLIGGTGADRLFGEDGNDQLFGGDSDDFLYGGNGDDTLAGEAGRDELYGDAGNDALVAGDGGGILNGGDGNDRLIGGAGVETMWGGNGADTLVSGGGADTLNGDAGNDVLIDSASAAATMRGGADDDVFIVRNPGTIVQEFGGGGTDTVYVYVNGWLPPSNVERVIYMDGAAPPSDAVLALHATALRPAAGTTTIFRYIFVDAPFNQSKSGTSLFQGLYLPEGQSLQMVPVDQNMRQGFRQAANEFERLANIQFVEVTGLAEADFAVGSHNMTFGGYAGLGLQPGSTSIQPYMISSNIQTSGLVEGGFGYSTMVHELGHIIGLKHPFEGAFQLAGNDADNGRYSLMSYGRGKANDGLMIFDIETTRAIYGARAVATGDDVYRFDQANRFFTGLVDDGGIDLIDLSGNANGATLDLAAGNFSTVNISAPT